jgi:glycosyltransferase involved in cell wall biosynthesis
MSAVELSLVIPVKDEEEAIVAFLHRVIPILEKLDDPAARSFEILFIDDGSSDSTLGVIRDAHAAAIAQFRQGSRAFGRARLRAGPVGDPDGRRHAGPARGDRADARQVAQRL